MLDGEFTFDLDGDVRVMRKGDVARDPVLGAARRVDDRQPAAWRSTCSARRGRACSSWPRRRADGGWHGGAGRRRGRRWTSGWPAAGRSSPAAPRAWARPSPPSCWPRARRWRSAPGTPPSWRRRGRGAGQAGRRQRRSSWRWPATSPTRSRSPRSWTGPPRRWAGSTSWSTTPAGPGPGRFATLTDDDWQADIEVKLFSQIRCIRAALPHLRRQRRAAGHQHQRDVRALPGPGVPGLVGQPGLLPQPVQGPVDGAGQQRESWSTA